MKRFVPWAIIVILYGGCATQAAAPAGAPVAGHAFTGEVWVWDTEAGTVTLRQGMGFIRVKVAPDQLVGLQPHQTATVRGELAPPAEIPTMLMPARPMVAVPRGPIDEAEATGTVVAIDRSGRLTIDSPQGRLTVWVASGAEQRFPPGRRVRVRTAVQRVDMVDAGGAPATPEPSALPEGTASASAPGDYGVVTGPVTRVDPPGTLTVQSPTGPVTVAVPGAAGYRVAEHVRVRTSVHPAP